MSGVRHILAVTAAIGFADIAQADEDIVWTFASCTGRLSAEMEHQWLMSDPASDQTKARRAVMISLLEATAGPDDGPLVLSRRIAAKHAHARLLTRAHFNDDENDAEWARNRARAAISACNGLLLS